MLLANGQVNCRSFTLVCSACGEAISVCRSTVRYSVSCPFSIHLVSKEIIFTTWRNWTAAWATSVCAATAAGDHGSVPYLARLKKCTVKQGDLKKKLACLLFRCVFGNNCFISVVFLICIFAPQCICNTTWYAPRPFVNYKWVFWSVVITAE